MKSRNKTQRSCEETRALHKHRVSAVPFPWWNQEYEAAFISNLEERSLNRAWSSLLTAVRTYPIF
ncbi:hypothetical protein CLU79DRAFT_776200 [Phycomyces nitens]|nr:hypothetical protein CLU79DRAFT_776200 [Phycomyces nitens]